MSGGGLTITRKIGEAIILITPSGDRIEIRVRKLRDTRVRLNIRGDKAIEVYREEVEPKRGDA